MKKRLRILFIFLVILVNQVDAQLSLTQTSLAYHIDFDQTITGINNGPMSSVAGLSILGNPAGTGQLEGMAWEIVSDAASATAPAGFITAVSAGFNTINNPGQSVYGWGAWNFSNNHALAILPAGNAGTPGSLTLKLFNNSGLTLTTLAISYTVGAYNDKDRSNSAGFLHSQDNLNYWNEPQALYTSPGIAGNNWDTCTKTLGLTGLNWQAGSYYYLRWFFQDVSGSGLRDEFLLDNITLTGSSLYGNTPVGLKFLAINNGVPPSATEDFSLLVQVVDSNQNPAAVQAETIITLSHISGTGSLTGKLSDTLSPGLHTKMFHHVCYSQVEPALVLTCESTGLISDTSEAVAVLPKAVYLVFTNFTDTIMLDENIPAFGVRARRADHSNDPNYKGIISLAIYSGPGNLLGSLSQSTQAGLASFSDIHFDQAGSYMLVADSDSLPAVLVGVIVVLPPPGMTELVVPRYFGSRSGPSVNNCRTPFAVCLQFNHHAPMTLYNLQVGIALTSEPPASFGAGNIWNGLVFTTSVNAVTGYFNTDSAGNSGPVWVFLQPTGNSARFEAGTEHHLRLGICPYGSSMPAIPSYYGDATMLALDIPDIPRTTSTDDDGAFLLGKTDTSLSAQYCLIYDNAEGSGMPLYCSQINTATSTNTLQTELLPIMDSVWRQIPYGSKGSFAAVIPSGTIAGIRRVEARNANNEVISSQTDADGVWPCGGNTTNLMRRQLITLGLEEIPMVNTIVGTVSYANEQASPLDSTVVSLTDQDGNIILETTTDSLGRYRMSGMNNGDYLLKAHCSKRSGGYNSADALLIIKNFVRLVALQGIYRLCAQVSEPEGDIVNSVDALMVAKRYAGLISAFPAGDWFFESVPVSVNSQGIISRELRGISRGDVNGDNVPF